MAETGNKTPKKLADLRVIDLKCQLEQRGLETRGVKAALSDRLKKVGCRNVMQSKAKGYACQLLNYSASQTQSPSQAQSHAVTGPG